MRWCIAVDGETVKAGRATSDAPIGDLAILATRASEMGGALILETDENFGAAMASFRRRQASIKASQASADASDTMPRRRVPDALKDHDARLAALEAAATRLR